MRRPEWASHTIAAERTTIDAATALLSAGWAKVYQPAASIRLLARIATAKQRAMPTAATRSRREACRSSSAGMAHVGATTPVPTGWSSRGRAPEREPGTGVAAGGGASRSSTSATDSRQAEHRPSTVGGAGQVSSALRAGLRCR